MESTKIRYTLHGGCYTRTAISGGSDFTKRCISDELPETLSIGELIPTLIKKLLSMNVVIYEISSRYFYRGGVPAIVEVSVR